MSADLSAARRTRELECLAGDVLAVVGGKLTTYRRVARDVVDVIARRPGVAASACRRRNLPAAGAQPLRTRKPGIPARPARRHGAKAAAVAALADGRPELLEPVAPGVGVLGAELRWAVEREGAPTASDVLGGRTRLGLVPAGRAAALPALERLVPEGQADGIAA